MSCGMCGPIQFFPVHHAPDPALYVERETSATAVDGVNGQRYSLLQPLVASHLLRDGWAALVRIKGVTTVVNKNSAVETFNEAMRLHELNGEEYWFGNIWLNLNLQWIPRIPEKDQIVTVAQLESISNPVTP